MMEGLLGTTKTFKGPVNVSDMEAPIIVLQAGINRITTNGQLGIAFIEQGEVTDMFSLDPGTHRVKYPGDHVIAIFECEPETKWFVKYGGWFNPSDPTRIEASLVRPRTQQQEMQAYMNELAARAFGKQISDELRSGQAEFDASQDDYSLDHEDDTQAPLSVYQLKHMMDEIQAEIAIRTPPKDQSSTVNEKPVVVSTPTEVGKVEPKGS